MFKFKIFSAISCEQWTKIQNKLKINKNLEFVNIVY